MKSSSRVIGLSLLAVVFLMDRVQAGLMDDIAKSANVLKDKAEKTLNGEAVKFCLTNDNCNTEFFRLDNYCCNVACCNVLSYVQRGG